MTDWTAGYVADIGYTYGYYTELNPARLTLPLLNAGLAPPEITSACELGFGQGLSINLHAAASGVHWSGTDFNPSQAAFAVSVRRITFYTSKDVACTLAPGHKQHEDRAWPRSDAPPPNGASWCKAGRAAARHKPTTADATASP